MGEKKSWRDYSKNYSTDDPSSEEKTGGWKDYTSDNSAGSGNAYRSWRYYSNLDPASIVAKNATERVDTWINNYNFYVAGYQSRYKDRKFTYEDSYVSDSASWLENSQQQADAMETERQAIITYIQENKDYLNPEWVDEVLNLMQSRRDNQLTMLDYAKTDNEWWSNFGSEEMISKYGSAEDAYKYHQRSDGYYQKYNGMTSEELGEVLTTLDAGEERDWVSSYKVTLDQELITQKENELAFYEQQVLNLYENPEVYQATLAPYTGHGEIDENGNEVEHSETYMNMIAGDDEDLIAHLASQYEDRITTLRKELAILKPDEYGTFEFFKIPDKLKDGAEWYEYPGAVIGSVLDAGVNLVQGVSKAVEGFGDFAVHAVGWGADGLAWGADKLGLDWAEKGLSTAADAAHDLAATDYTAKMTSGVEQFLDGYSVFGRTTDSIMEGTGQVLTTIATSGIGAAAGLGKAAVSALTYGTMGLSSMGSGMSEAYAAGASDMDAFTYGLIAGVADTATEMLFGGLGKGVNMLGFNKGALGVDDLVAKKVSNLFSSQLAKNWVQWGVKAGFEGAEEVLAGLMQGWGKYVTYMSESGMSLGDIIHDENLLEQFVVGFFTSSFAQVGDLYKANKAGVDFIQEDPRNQQMIDTGKAIIGAEGGLDAFSTLAYEVAGQSDSKTAKKITKQTDKVTKRVKAGKTNDATARKVGELVETVQSATTSNIQAKIKQFVVENYEKAVPIAKKRLEELGETENVDKIAKLVAKRATGQELTAKEKSTLVRSQYGSQVAKEMIHSSSNLAYKSLEDRIGTDGRFGVSETGKATIRGTDKVIDLVKAKVVKVGDGQVTFKLEDGTEVSAGEIDFADDNQSYLVSAVAGIENITPAAATAIIRDVVDTTKPIGAQLNGIDEAYTYGYYGYSEADLKAGKFTTKLTSEQMMSAYKLGQAARQFSDNAKTEQFKAMRTAAQAEAEKAVAEGKEAPQAKNLTITYNQGGGKVVSIEEAGITDPKRSGAANVAEILHKMGLGTKVEFFSSYESKTMKVKDKKTGKLKNARVFINDQGVEQIAYSGVYRKSDGTIRVDLNAYNGRGLTLNALAHELTHFIQQWSDRKYKVLVDFLMREYENTDMTMHERVLREQKRLEEIRGEEVSYDEAYDEVVANAMSKMFDDGKLVEKLAKLKEQDKNLAQKLWEGFKEILAKFIGIYKKEGALFQDASDIMEMKDTFEQLQNMFAEALVEASENYQASLTPGVEGTVFSKTGEAVAHCTEDGAVQLSLHTYDTEGRDVFRDYLEKCVSSKKLTKTEMTEMLDGIEEIYQTCKEFKDKYAPFSAWSDAAVVRDTHGRPVFSVVTPNGDYKMNLDFSLVCKKRRTLDAVFNEMSKRGIIDDFELGQKSVVKINEIIRKYGLETACALCFVDAKRFRQASMADSFTSLYNELVESLVPEDQKSSIGYFNFSGYDTIKKVENGIDTWDSSKLDFSHINHVLKTYGSGTVEYKAAKYIKTHAEGRKLLLRGDFMSSKGFDAVKSQNPDVLKLYNSKKGTGGPKAAFGDVQYMNEIIQKARWWTPSNAYSVGGVRVQSFSDYVPRMVFDYVQMIYDLAATKLPAHAYTKEALFVKQFGLTGIKINMSLIPAIAEGGIAPGLDSNGNYVWAGESFDYDTAKDIQNAEGYTENCGTICVGVSKEHIIKLLRDPNIRMVIPYHKSGLNPIVAHMNKIAEFHDYTNDQRTKGKDGKALGKDFDFNKALHDMGENANPKAVADQYLKWCAAHGYTPRFAEFAMEENYYKLLEDFTLYDMDGKYVPQRAVKAVFPTNDSAFGSMKSLIEAGLQEDAVIEGKRDKSLSSIVDEIQKTIPKTEAEIEETQVEQADRDLEQYSSQETDADTAPEINAKDVVDSGNGVLAVNINSRKSGLNRYKKSKWASVISKQIRDTLQGHAIYAADGDIIRITDRAPGEVSYGTDSNKLFAEAKKTGDYSAFNKKMITADHAMTIIALSTYDSWSANTEDPTDMFKRDGLNHRKVNLVIDGEPYTAVVLTCLNIDPEQTEDYGEKFYDIVSIEKQAKHSAMSGTFATKATPHKIRFADGSPDMLTIAQKERIVNRKNATYATGDAGTKTAMAEAFSRAKELKSSQETDADNAPTFYSRMGKVVEGMKQEKFGASSVISMLRGRGVKAEEIRWSGIQAFLDGKKSVTKAELQEFIAGSMLQIEEAVLDGKKKAETEVRKHNRKEYGIYMDGKLVETVTKTDGFWRSTVNPSGVYESREDAITAAERKLFPKPKWGSYTVEGGTNYREVLFKLPGATYSNTAMQNHWGKNAQGVLAHARVQDFNTFIGKMLFIEEIQSDWHNEGHNKGYVPKGQTESIVSEEAVPDAPFKDTYHEFVLKRLIREAAENGYDSIGWTTADIQSQRWSDEFAEGYRIEYDQDIPKFMRKYGKQWDSTVGKTILDNGTEVWGMAITDSMKQSVLKDGQELYSEHDTDYSNRDLLANAFEGIAKDSEEYRLIQQYKGHIAELNSLENKLSEFNREIHEIRFGTDGQYDAEKLKRLEAEAKKIAEAISRHDRKLLSLEASEPLRKVIEQERKKEAQKTKAHVKEIQENKKARAEQTELRHKIRKTIRDLDKVLKRGNKKTNVKEDMKGFVSKALELADYLFTDHISNDDLIRNGIDEDLMRGNEARLVEETKEILDQLYDHADSLTDEEFTRLDEKRKVNEEKLRDLLTQQRNRRLNTPVYNLFNDLVTEYAILKNSKQEAVKGAYDPNVERFLRSYIGESNGETDSDRVTLLQNMRVADMTTEELWKLHNAYKMVLHSVREANKLHIKGKTETIEQVAGRIMGDFSKRKTPDGKVSTVLRNLSNKIGWSYEKLYYALDRIGSDAFTELVMNIANSENIVMQDIMEAVAFRDEMVEEYGFNNWDVNKKIDRVFLDNTGKKFKLTLGELMSLYAYSRRAGAWDHIEYGGFVFGEAALTDPKPADSYKLSKAQCEAITGLLTKEQKAYVEAMQKFLSETMGEKGNEVSMQLYGIKMFGEKNYFPIHIAGQFKAQANESQAKAAAGFSSMSNAGFTHAQNPNAKAPFVLEGFNEIWADHVNEMSRYHGTVPALEDMRKVMNRSFYSESGMESMAIKQLMENSYGKEAVEYFDSLYREANSGAITDKLQKPLQKLLAKFRKNSVAYSLSVLIQQPASLVRAYAMIDRKYFGVKGVGAITSGVAKLVSNKWTKAHSNAYNEMLKYAPGVTMAKEIGGFDTHTGGSIRSYLLDTNKRFTQKVKTDKHGKAMGVVKAAYDFVDDNAIANLPSLADKIAWIEIWNACKRETVATHKELRPNSEEFMQAVGERFTEVIRATQVYDSMFSKSPMLKSKNIAVQYLVSFMNEPNTVANMAESAVRDVMRGDWKSGTRKAHVVIHGVIFTSVLKALAYAMRDDDEEESYTEKYIEAIVGSLMDDFNPLNYLPIARDVWSIAQGYDVERADMAIVSDAIGALNNVIKYATADTEGMTEEQLIELDKKCTDATWQLVESVAGLFGIPAKNIRREVNAVLDHARIASDNAGMTTLQSAWDKVYDAVIDSIPFMSTKESKTDRIYDAIISDDNDYLDRLKSTYKTEDAYNNAVRKALRENDSRIHDAAQARYEGRTEDYKRIFREIYGEGNFSWDEIMDAINSEESKIRDGVEPDKVTSQYNASSYVEAIILDNSNSAQAMKWDIIDAKVANGKSQKEAEKEFESDVASGIGDAYSSGLLDKTGAENMLVDYAGMDEEDAVSRVNYWAFCEDYPKFKNVYTEAHVAKYYEFGEPAGISVEMYAKFIKGTKGLKTIRDEWGDVEVTKREQVLEVIDSLPLTWQQKDALYLAYGYDEDQIWDVPW